MPVLSTLGAAIANVYGFTSGLIKDQYFNLVSLLLPGNGTNGKQNNAFIDSSSNAFSITPNGDVTQGTFSPFSQTGWGAYFDGSNDSLSVASDASWALSGVFCVEAWVWNGGTQTNFPGVFATPTNGFVLAFKTDSSQFGVAQAAVAWTSILASPPTANVWTHVVVTRDSSNVMRMFYNGVLQVNAVVSTSFAQGALTIGAQSGSGSLLGYLSNARWIKGSIPTSYQTSSTTNGATIFAPPTSPLTTTSQGATSGDVKLLTLQDNRFKDSSSNAFTITANNGVAITPFSPFAPTSSYSAAAVGGSGYFDGSSDYLTAGSATDWTFLNNGSSWTIQFSLYYSGSSRQTILSTNAATVAVGFDLALSDSAANEVNFTFFRGVSGSFSNFRSNAALVLNSWNTIAITFDTSTKTCSFYINGVAQGSSSDTGFAYSSSSPAYTLGIGRYQAASPGSYYTGYISNLRISNSVRTGLTTVPTAPFTSDANTSLLLNFTNAGVVDATAKNVLETEGNAQISTAQSKWGGGSIAFDGTGDYLTGAATWAISGSESYTFEAWIYPTSVAGDLCIYETRTSSGSGFVLFINSSGRLQVYDSVGLLQTASTTTLVANTWTYIAITRVSGSSTNTFYVNGTSAGTFSLASFATATALRIGARNDGLAAYVGYIDDFRTTKGYARTITASPTAPFPVQ